jgi:hypothetical protein
MLGASMRLTTFSGREQRGRDVAIKVMLARMAADGGAAARFQREWGRICRMKFLD